MLTEHRAKSSFYKVIQIRFTATFLAIISILWLPCFAGLILAEETEPTTETDISVSTDTSISEETLPTQMITETSSQATTIEPSEVVELPDSLKPRNELLDSNPVNAPSVDGSAYLLYDATSNTMLIGNNYDTALPPASITKVMTILLALENLSLTDTITVTPEMYNTIPADYARLGIVEGEVLTVEDCLYACLLKSANDACMALAIHMGGTAEGFAAMMNERALELGCTKTNFTNPYGLSDPAHVTSCHDMALILQEALTHEEYTIISTTSSYTMPATNKYNDTRVLSNGNRFIATTTYSYEYYIGGKTGFTDLSQYTITAAASKDDQVLIGVIFAASCSEIRYANLISLFDYGFQTYTTTRIDTAEYQALKNSTIEQIQNSIESSDLSILDENLVMLEYFTTTATRATNGYSSTIDMSGIILDPSLDSQTIVLPVNRIYADGMQYLVGELTVTIGKEKQHVVIDNKESNDTNWLSVIGKAILIILLVVVLISCVIGYLTIRKKQNNRNNRRPPRVL